GLGAVHHVQHGTCFVAGRTGSGRQFSLWHRSASCRAIHHSGFHRLRGLSSLPEEGSESQPGRLKSLSRRERVARFSGPGEGCKSENSSLIKIPPSYFVSVQTTRPGTTRNLLLNTAPL